ncbi:MAG: helix-turn-helix domain-containing protein [Catalinimonas sp.]
MGRSKAFDEEEVLDRAVELFWQEGYHATSMRDLTERLGINASSLYHTYGDKQKLFRAALERYRTQAGRAVTQRFEAAPDVRTAVRELLLEATRPQPARGGRGCFMVNTTVELAAQDAQVAEIVRLNREALEAALAERFEGAQARGEVAAQHTPTALARTVFNTLQGLRVTACHPLPAAAEEVIATTLALLD